MRTIHDLIADNVTMVRTCITLYLSSIKSLTTVHELSGKSATKYVSIASATTTPGGYDPFVIANLLMECGMGKWIDLYENPWIRIFYFIFFDDLS